jgi:hypothetical protein
MKQVCYCSHVLQLPAAAELLQTEPNEEEDARGQQRAPALNTTILPRSYLKHIAPVDASEHVRKQQPHRHKLVRSLAHISDADVPTPAAPVLSENDDSQHDDDDDDNRDDYGSCELPTLFRSKDGAVIGAADLPVILPEVWHMRGSY